MHYTVQHCDLKALQCDCLLLGIFENKLLPSTTQQFDALAKGAITTILNQGDIAGKLGETLMLYPLSPQESLNTKLPTRVLLVGAGKENDINDPAYRKIISRAVQCLSAPGIKDVMCALVELPVKGRDSHWKIRQIIDIVEDSRYTFNQLKSKKEPTPSVLSSFALSVSETESLSSLEKAITESVAISSGKKLTRDLANLPGNICTPTYLAEHAQALAKRFKTIRTTVYEESELKKMGMGALLSVAKGSEEPAKLVTMEYNSSKKDKKSNDQKPIVLLGKGITFDSGGISLKPGPGMDEMKFDMCGAASIIGTLQVIAELQLPLSIVGVFAASENLPSGRATKPGDIVTTLSGQTVEILNTDAEGRLILCDALTFCERFNPEIVIDVATLTGNIILALGHNAAGLFSNDEAIAKDLINAGNYTGERLWQMPLWEDYHESLKSNFADVANVGTREAGAIIAACYLSRFTKNFRWAHIDIAGTAWKSGKEKGATGRPVSLLTQYLLTLDRSCHA